jgi:hypothetical protein
MKNAQEKPGDGAGPDTGDAEPKARQKKVKLLEKHEHEGREYPAGSELSLDKDQAEWLIGIKRAEAV